MRNLLASAASALLLVTISAEALAAQKPAIGKWGIDTSVMSRTIRPGDDFYRHVNEGWLNSAKIPTGMSQIASLVEVYLSTEQRVAAIIDEARSGTSAKGTPERMIADFHRSHSDMAHRNRVGLQPIASTLATIGGIRDRVGLARFMGTPGVESMIGGGVGTDVTNPRLQTAAVGVSGLSMPSRDYYLDPAEPYASHRKALQAYMAASFQRAGFPDADTRAAKVMALETEMARRHWTAQQQRDPVRMNRFMSLTELQSFAPGFPWTAYLREAGFEGQSRFKVMTDTAVRDVAKLFADTPVEDIRSYLLFHTLDDFAPYLSEPWVQAHFDFHQKTLKGVAQRRPAELESVAAVNSKLGEEIGRIYVARHFSAADRAEVKEMVDFLRETYAERIRKLDWMDEPTRAEALTKLARITDHIGFPDRWHDRTGVVIAPDDLVGNVSRLARWERQDSLKVLAEGTRKWEFGYSAHEINAGYSPSQNSITFPAGILQPPFFDPAADPAVNFGSIAAVIGHEFGHAFDDQGSRSDGDGRLREWWTPQARAQFEQRTAGLVRQFDQYEPVPGVRINGRQNLGENIGDLGGLSAAHSAYRKYVAQKQGGQAPVIDGFTGDQRFFMAWAQLWRNLTEEAEVRVKLLSDPHSPGEFRVNGVVRNVDAWYEAFGVKPGDKLYLSPEQRVRIW